MYSVVVVRLGSAPVQRPIVTSGSFVTCMGYGSDQGVGRDLPRSVVPPAAPWMLAGGVVAQSWGFGSFFARVTSPVAVSWQMHGCAHAERWWSQAPHETLRGYN